MQCKKNRIYNKYKEMNTSNQNILIEELLLSLLSTELDNFRNVDHKLIVDVKSKFDEVLRIKRQSRDEDGDVIIKKFESLSLDEEKIYENYRSTQRVLTYYGWKIKPDPIYHMKNTLNCDEIIKILTNDSSLIVNMNELPQLISIKSLPEKIELIEYKEMAEPIGKPNLLIALSSLLYDIIKNTKSRDHHTIISTMKRDTNIIITRNSLKKILSHFYDSKEEWTVYCYKPADDYPIFIERGENYDVNNGTIGNQFERFVTSSSTYERVYAISSGKLSDLSIILTGEIDAFDENCEPVEIKTKPYNVDSADRKLTNWVQSSLVGTNRFVTASFLRRKKKDPAVFLRKNIISKTLDEYCRDNKNILNDKSKNDIYKYGTSILKKIQSSINSSKVDTVYMVKVSSSDKNNIIIEEVQRTFPISMNTIINTTTAILGMFSSSSFNQEQSTNRNESKQENFNTSINTDTVTIKKICFNFQKGACRRSNCKFEHE